MEIILAIWAILLGLWSLLLITASIRYHKDNARLQLERIRWARYCENWRRQNNHERNEWN